MLTPEQRFPSIPAHYKYVMGVDPGLSGAIAVYAFRERQLVSLIDVPVVATRHQNKRGSTFLNRRYINVPELIEHFNLFAKETYLVVIEKVHAQTYFSGKIGEVRGQGAASSFNFGLSTGLLIGTAAGVGIPVAQVPPSVWKAHMLLDHNKKYSVEAARNQFPHMADKFRNVNSHDRAEAAFLALFGAVKLMSINRLPEALKYVNGS